MARRTTNFVFLIFGFLIFLNILAWIVVYDLSQPRFLEVNFFDVGQGDAIFIETPQRHQILIDGGPTSAILEKLGKEMPFWDRSIDLIILTHPEHDHLAGLIEVLKRYKVENILWTGIKRDTPEYNEWLKLITTEGAKIFIAESGQKIIVSKNIFKVLYPFENLEGKVIKNSNDTSIVIKLVFGENSFLFTGDISKSAEKKILNEKIDIDSDVLKVAHHGSKTSSANEFIEKVSPKIAVILAGKDNRYGHPHQKVLETLAKHDITILRTDQSGDIKIFSDGNNFKVID
ncbi:MAG: ComEC/Rec2 family competence protein [Patescibacteria group bacterium]|nr:ComEC/Rec2 family competence protein [Patescibacteria group bacterium]